LVAKTPPGFPQTTPEGAREVPEEGSTWFSAPKRARDKDMMAKTATRTRKLSQKPSPGHQTATKNLRQATKMMLTTFTKTSFSVRRAKLKNVLMRVGAAPPASEKQDDHQNSNTTLPSCSEDCTREKRFGTHYPRPWFELLSASVSLRFPFGGARSLSMSLLFRRTRSRHAPWNKLPWSMCSALVFVCVSGCIVPKRKEQAFNF